MLVAPYVQLQLFETPWTIAHQSLLSLEFIYICVYIYILGLRASQVVLVVKNPPANSGGRKRHRFNPYSGQEDPWRRAWQPTPVFLSGESQGQRSLVGYSPQGCSGSDTTEAT